MEVIIVRIPREYIHSGDKDKIYQEVKKSVSKYNPEQTLKSRNKFHEYLDNQKYRRTWERDKVLNAILSNDRIFSCKVILDSLKQQSKTSSISLKTIQRTFKILLKAGVISEVNNNVGGLFQTTYFELVV